MSAAVEVKDVARSFGAVRALDGVDLSVAQGEFFGLLGPNGAGKTTLISIIAGLTRADRGTVRVLGHDVVGDFRAARRSLGVVPQELVFDPFFTVRETLRVPGGLLRAAQAGETGSTRSCTTSISRRRRTPTCARSPAA